MKREEKMRSKLLALMMVLAMAGNVFAAPVLINGAGATFPYPIYSKWFNVYSKINPAVQFNYQSIGSGGGIKQITAKTVDFGATDGPMTPAQLSEAPGRIYHIPMVMGAVAVIYNLEGVQTGLKLSSDVLSDIYLGKVKMWNDQRIAALNPGQNLPNEEIIVVH